MNPLEPARPARSRGAAGKEDLLLLLVALLCLLTLANTWMLARLTTRLDAESHKAGLFPPQALRVPPGDDGEFADLNLSDVLLGMAELDSPAARSRFRLDSNQAGAVRECVPAMRRALGSGDAGTMRQAADQVKRCVTREHLLFFQKVRKINYGRPRNDAACLARVEAFVGSSEGPAR